MYPWLFLFEENCRKNSIKYSTTSSSETIKKPNHPNKTKRNLVITLVSLLYSGGSIISAYRASTHKWMVATSRVLPTINVHEERKKTKLKYQRETLETEPHNSLFIY